jgi:hypothetical protein
MEQGPTFRVTVPKYPTKDANYRILARQRSRFTHYYFYIRDETLGLDAHRNEPSFAHGTGPSERTWVCDQLVGSADIRSCLR